MRKLELRQLAVLALNHTEIRSLLPLPPESMPSIADLYCLQQSSPLSPSPLLASPPWLCPLGPSGFSITPAPLLFLLRVTAICPADTCLFSPCSSGLGQQQVPGAAGVRSDKVVTPRPLLPGHCGVGVAVSCRPQLPLGSLLQAAIPVSFPFPLTSSLGSVPPPALVPCPRFIMVLLLNMPWFAPTEPATFCWHLDSPTH